MRLYTAIAGAGETEGWANWEQAVDCALLASEFEDMPNVSKAIAAFGQAMDDDFNTPVAIAALFDLATEVNKSQDNSLKRQLAKTLRALASSLGLLNRAPSELLQSGSSGLDKAKIEALIAERTAAKKAKDFARADQIRADLAAQGVILEDGPAGTSWRVGE